MSQLIPDSKQDLLATHLDMHVSLWLFMREQIRSWGFALIGIILIFVLSGCLAEGTTVK